MIPKNITRNDVLNAIKKIGNEGFPHRRKSIKYDIWCEYPYPPKYVISIANLIANGQKLKPSRFSGGAESNSFLINLGFVIVRKS